ncbi:hypothetical protein F2Q68_00012443 [Brassica cretica]|uniref:Uncharacterized protein n=1 Tax=Brassica cretica TaxID=69181 RepID=A0A8S9KPT6_BRACR|nr:hypothetical protein F2Q68_00012443 [Brassica cretica]
MQVGSGIGDSSYVGASTEEGVTKEPHKSLRQDNLSVGRQGRAGDENPFYLAAWNPASISGSYQLKLVRTMKMLKKDLRNINKTHYSGISRRIKEQYSRVEDLQRQILTQPTPQLATKEHRERDKLNLLLNAKQKFYRQRSRVRWADVGDRNTTVYHHSVSKRNADNRIT